MGRVAELYTLGRIDRMWIFTPFILAGILFLAVILGSMGVLCTDGGPGLVPSLLFGLPVVVVSLLIFVLFVEMKVIWAGVFAVPSLIIGSFVVWRGFRTGQKRRDYLSAIFVCGGVFLLGLILIQIPDITRVIFSGVLPPAPIL